LTGHRSIRALPRLTALSVLVLAAGCGDDGAGAYAVPPNSVLLDPEASEFMAEAPETFNARFETSKGDFVIEVVRDWAPNGADRFYNLVRNGFYDGTRFYRAIDGFMVQFGLHGDPAVTEAWQSERITDDPVVETNAPGTVTFAMASERDTRTTQIFINLVDNARLDDMGFAPIGRIIEGMDVVRQLYTGYGEGPPGRGPDQNRVRSEGNVYLTREFPDLDYVERATVVSERRPAVE